MAQMTIQGPTSTGGSAITYGAVADGDKFLNDGKTWLHVKNGGGSPITVTITAQSALGCPAGLTHDEVVTVTNGSDKPIGPFDPKRFNDTDGNVTVHYSGVTSVTAAALHTTS